jgi:hypothetical protein
MHQDAEMPVIRPPVLNEMRRGARLAKSLAGLTTFAAMFTEIVAMSTPRSETTLTDHAERVRLDQRRVEARRAGRGS